MEWTLENTKCGCGAETVLKGGGGVSLGRGLHEREAGGRRLKVPEEGEGRAGRTGEPGKWRVPSCLAATPSER